MRVLKDRRMEYLEAADIELGGRSAFRCGRACVSNLSSFYTKMTGALREMAGRIMLGKSFVEVPSKW